MSKYYPGFGTTRPYNEVDRQVELQAAMKLKEEKEQALHDKIIKELYVEPKGTSTAQRGEGK